MDESASALTNVLFLCARNRLRSPTAEQVFAAWPGVETASAGLNPDADEVVGPELVEWADLIFVMERAHLAKLRKRFRPQAEVRPWAPLLPFVILRQAAQRRRPENGAAPVGR